MYTLLAVVLIAFSYTLWIRLLSPILAKGLCGNLVDASLEGISTVNVLFKIKPN